MKVIAIDSSGLVASVSVMEDDTMIAEYTMNYKKTHSQTLLPMLDQMVEMIELDKSTVDAIAVSAGPGSFTGLRIGSATAKGLGLAWNVPLISVPTLDALAYNLYGTDKLVCPIMDARRNQVYTGVYSWEMNEMVTLKEPCAVSIEELAAYLNETGREVIFLGDGVPVYKELLKDLLKVQYSFAPVHLSRQRAGAVASLAMKLYAEGKYESAAEHQPEYLRLSQAERERKEKDTGNGAV